ncbi:MAG: metallophosphoesterase family protein [Desulfobulbales bacterium]|nr:metallophosphoesterase family protein [Desulfobulbales bacterium]
MITIGAISDTHLIKPDKWFQDKAAACFADADMILHAGDLTSLSVLEVFQGKTVHAVHGNMCGPNTRTSLPASKIITVGRFRFALIHGAGYMHNIEDKLYDAFAPVDCIVYGHTHQAVCHRYGSTLMVNPGSFTITGTYAIIKVDENSMEGGIHHIGALP